MPRSPDRPATDFDEMLAGFDRIIHDKALQQQLLDAGLLVRTDAAGEAATGDARLREATHTFLDTHGCVENDRCNEATELRAALSAQPIGADLPVDAGVKHAEWWYATGRCEAVHHSDQQSIKAPCPECLQWAFDTVPSRHLPDPAATPEPEGMERLDVERLDVERLDVERLASAIESVWRSPKGKRHLPDSLISWVTGFASLIAAEYARLTDSSEADADVR